MNLSRTDLEGPMFKVSLLFVPTEQLSSAQKLRIKELQKECFSHVSRQDIEECFIAKSFGWIFGYEKARIVAQVELYSRNVGFEGKSIRLGGIGGTCVTTSKRNRGIATRMVKDGLRILKHMKCDVACLSADVKNHPSGGLYRSLGFSLMDREISFEDVQGQLRHDHGEMFVPVCSKETYDLIMNSEETFHVGRGYW